MPVAIPANYYNILGQIESGNNPFAKNPSSTASGRFQFIRSTWEGLGFNWNDRFDDATQWRAVDTFTQQNASYLVSKGIAATSSNLYAAHFLGVGTAGKVLGASNDTPLSRLVGSNVVNANPFLSGMDVGDFRGWLNSKTGSNSIIPGVDIDTETLTTLATAGAQIMGGDFLGAAQSGMQVLGSDGSDPISAFLEWLKKLFSINTATRFVFVFIGIILIIGAIIFITKADKIIVETVKEAGKVAVAAA